MNHLIDAFQEVRDREQKDSPTAARQALSKLAAPQATGHGHGSPTRARDQSQREEWVNVDHDEIFCSGSQTSEWQRMRAMREREQRAMTAERSRTQSQSGGSGRAATFSQFFSQVKMEWSALVRGIKQLGKSQSQENRYGH